MWKWKKLIQELRDKTDSEREKKKILVAAQKKRFSFPLISNFGESFIILFMAKILLLTYKLIYEKCCDRRRRKLVTCCHVYNLEQVSENKCENKFSADHILQQKRGTDFLRKYFFDVIIYKKFNHVKATTRGILS